MAGETQDKYRRKLHADCFATEVQSKKNCRTNYNNKKYIPLHAEEDM